jgi:hypothetical protein
MGPGSITIDDGVYQDALAAAAEHEVSVSAWITRCTRLETMRDALTRHQQWCAAEDLIGPWISRLHHCLRWDLARWDLAREAGSPAPSL